MKQRPCVSALEAHLGYWLRFVSNQVSQAFSLKVATFGVTVAEWVVLRELYDQDSVVPSMLAERLGMTRGAISKLVDRLVDKELVAKSVDKEDRRFQALTLTAGGRALVPELSALADRNDEEFFGHLDPADRAGLEAIMREIVRRQGLKSVPYD
ncbi:MAG TPA: MarR family transcriptional regulator [Geminicoccus sp.]|jgi:DNA-binding MarR family transcriptional regulator|uniref:MarR family winged helix-turn-helix transcriptional regulator n=1 Tax=Geminicoccus sp. TaxID=2024832 RepID=UPI002E357D33|nr:MarR family transcriptional regulator [Geminicoccus sp.]HEX2527941.1 MarR family transcriptional regulator [Geminicoccus sp.]